jgi:Flp pilus assembly protein TadD
MTGKVEEALAGYRKIKKESPKNVSIGEQRLNSLGFNLIRQKKLAEAIAILKLNTELYPESWNTYDSLGEAYMTNGDRELAIANYKKSLALNPENTAGAATLKKLQAEPVKSDK